MTFLGLKNSFPAFALLAAASVACAGPITYTFTGTGSGTLGGSSFSFATVTFTMTGDTTNIQDNLAHTACSPADGCDQIFNETGFFDNNSTPVQVAIAGLGSANLSGGVDLEACPTVCATPAEVNVQYFGGTGFIEVVNSSLLGTYVLSTAIGPVPSTVGEFNSTSQPTSAGTLDLTSFTGIIFNATLGAPSQPPPSTTPEPGTFAMVIGALAGAVGLKRKLSVGSGR
jgi:hypothetical protein